MARTGTLRMSPPAKAQAAKAKKSASNNENQTTASGNVSTAKQGRGRKGTVNTVNGDAMQVFTAITNEATAAANGTAPQVSIPTPDAPTQANGGGPGAVGATAPAANQGCSISYVVPQAAGSDIDPELLANSIQTLQ
ncbi:hypothetical protein BD410DRAFT_809730, partial [Rickenella mellea]